MRPAGGRTAPARAASRGARLCLALASAAGCFSEVQPAKHHLGAGTVGTVRLLLRDEQGRGVDGATASAGDAYTYSTTAFADRTTAALATQLGQSRRLSDVLRH